MSKKDQADAETTDLEGPGKDNSFKETQADKELSTPKQGDERQGGEVGEVDQAPKEMTKGAGASQAEVEPEEEPCEEEKLKKRVDELEDKLLRAAAEFDNYKKRMARQYDEILRFANDKILVELLEVVDNFERALQHSNGNSDNTDFEALRKGTELIFNQLTNLLDRYDITPIEAVGQPFDPNLHEALMQVESDDYPEGVVAMEVSKGYKQGNRVLRHSKVGVSKGKPEGEQKDDEV